MSTTLRSRLEHAITQAWLDRGALARSLWPLSKLFGALVALRRLAFDRGWLAATRVSRPVLVIGNRVVGGAGKTPTTIALVEHLRARGWHPGVVSRGHGRQGDAVQAVEAATPAALAGDEPLLIARRTGVPVHVGRDRVAAAQSLLQAHPEVDLVVSDDGLQHLRLARDLEVCVFDARGAGNSWLLPAGPLREPLSTPSRVPQLVLYTAGVRSTPLDGFVAHRRIAGLLPLEAWWRREASAGAGPHDTATRAARFTVCAGIAQPRALVASLEAAGFSVERLVPLGDHASFDPLPWDPSIADVVVTEKDAVKLDPQRLRRERPASRVWVAPLDFAIEPAFYDALDHALAGVKPTPPWTTA